MDNKKTMSLPLLGDFITDLGSSRLGLLFDTMPNPLWYLGNLNDVPERFIPTIKSISKIRQMEKLAKVCDINLTLLAEYYANVKKRWKNMANRISADNPNLGGDPSVFDTHEGINHLAYLEMLNARHLAASPWITAHFQENQYKSAVDLGGGAGTALEILKNRGVIEKGYLVDKADMVDTFNRTRFSRNADIVIKGDITERNTWFSLLDIVEKPSLWLISDVLHGRSLPDRDRIYDIISSVLEITAIVEKEHKINLLDILVREFMGFSPMDYLLFNMQLMLFTQGQLLTVENLKEELSKKDLSLKLLFNTDLYYYGIVNKEPI